MEKIIILPDVIKNLNETSFNYVDGIYDFIYTIPTIRYKETANKKFGEYYCIYKANRNTTWYIIFDRNDERFIVQYITNNHTEEYPYFISKIK